MSIEKSGTKDLSKTAQDILTGFIANHPAVQSLDSAAKTYLFANSHLLDVKKGAEIFAIGDIACMVTEDNPHGHPMVAQPAIQQAKNLADNFIRIVVFLFSG